MPKTLDPNGFTSSADFRLSEGLADDCVVKSLTTFFHVTAADLAAVTANARLVILLRHTIVVNGQSQFTNVNLVDLPATTQRPLSGTQMGTNCTTNPLRFTEGGPPFSDAQPPYAGTFRPFGQVPPPTGTGNFDAFDGKKARSSFWQIVFINFEAPLRLECWTVEFELERLEPPPLQENSRDN